MINRQQAHRYDIDDKHRIYNESSWLGRIFARPVMPFTNDEKRPWRESSARSFISLSGWRKYIRRHWSPSKYFTSANFPYSHSTRPSLTNAKASISSAAPTVSTFWFVVQCAIWYSTSALSSNTGKAIMTQFRYPVTLTYVQFGFVALYCLLFMSPAIRFSTLRMPTRAIFRSTLPMGMFQVGGHMASSMAISRIPVSTVHTIKALSPLFTVTAYALLFRVSYSTKTYISLLPLTIGVMLACSFDVSASNTVGILCAFASALVFVSSNIFFKKIMPSTTHGSSNSSVHKIDKLNLLFYSATMAFILMTPMWLYTDLPKLLSARNATDYVVHPSHGHTTSHSVLYYFIMNGTVNFAQNIIAFVILSSTSPVTYSIASLIKRVAVICIAIVWFNQSVHPIQAFGITMTFLGLYMYNSAKGDVERGEKKMRRVEAARDLILPSTKADSMMTLGEALSEQPVAESTGMGRPSPAAHGRPRGVSFSNSSPPVSTFSPPLHRNHHQQQSGFASSRHPIHTPTFLPNLSIDISSSAKFPPALEASKVTPTELYPSPPLSLDSPPPMPPHLDFTGQMTKV